MELPRPAREGQEHRPGYIQRLRLVGSLSQGRGGDQSGIALNEGAERRCVGGGLECAQQLSVTVRHVPSTMGLALRASNRGVHPKAIPPNWSEVITANGREWTRMSPGKY